MLRSFRPWLARRQLTIKSETESTVVQHFRPQFVFPGAAAVGCPHKPRVADLAGSGEFRQLRQHPRQDRFVARAVMGRAEGAAHGVIDKNRARRRDLADNIEGRARQQCRNTLIFNHMRDETNGLVAKRSIRHQQCQVNFDLGHFPGDGGSQFGFNLLLAPDPAHD